MQGGIKIEAWGHQNRGPRAPKSSSGRMLGVLSARTRFGGRLVAREWPTWPQLGSQDGAKMEKKSMQKSIKKLMHLGIDFWKDLEGFWEPKWSHVGTQIDQKSMPIAKSDFLKNRTLPAAGDRFFKIRGSKLGVKIDQMSTKK